MLPLPLALLCAGLALGRPAPAQTGSRAVGPPGTVFVPGGPTRIGSTVDEIRALAQENDQRLQLTVGETPRHTAQVEGFFLMVAEVTNEQYEVFVRATAARPPRHWAAEAIEQARLDHARATALLQEDARKLGRTLERPPFDPSAWWKLSWRGKPWAVPAGKETLPVVWVDHSDAEAYARWAGLRLMTEHEYQRAVRGDTDRVYPWGDRWDESLAVHEGTRAAEPRPVGSCPGGAVNGVHDLAGNAWEWTSSPFAPYPGYEDLVFEVGLGSNVRTIHGFARFDAAQRVVVGGSFQTGPVACRAATRRPTDRGQETDAVGLRGAASARPGLDAATFLLRDGIPLGALPPGARLDASRVIAAERWRSSAGTARAARKGQGGSTEPQPLPGYAVVEAYDHVLFVPAVDLGVVTLKDLAAIARERGPAVLGFLSTTIQVAEPSLPAGVWLVAFLPAGAAAPAAAPALDPALDHLLLLDREGRCAASLSGLQIEIAKPFEAGIELGAENEALVRAMAWCKLSQKVVAFAFALRFGPEALAGEWRR